MLKSSYVGVKKLNGKLIQSLRPAEHWKQKEGWESEGDSGREVQIIDPRILPGGGSDYLITIRWTLTDAEKNEGIKRLEV